MKYGFLASSPCPECDVGRAIADKFTGKVWEPRKKPQQRDFQSAGERE